MTPTKSAKKLALLAETVDAGAGNAHESAMGSERPLPQQALRPAKGRPPQAPTIGFTVRLRPEIAELLQRLTADLQARAIRGELARRDATIAAVVEEGLRLYAKIHEK